MPLLHRSSRVFKGEGLPLKVMRVPHHGDMYLHGHEFHELVVVVNGSGFHRTGTETRAVSAGDVFLLKGKALHGYVEAENLGVVNILFSPRSLGLPQSDLGNIPGYHVLFQVEPRIRRPVGGCAYLHLPEEDLAETSRLIDTLDQELRLRRPGYRFMACSHLMALIGFLSRCCSHIHVASGVHMMGLGKVLSYLDEHYARRITLRKLAKMAGMSTSTFLRRFREVTGRTPVDYLIRLRIDRACDLLLRKDLRITDIAFQCGFEDSNYFARQFRRVTGVSPRRYRQSGPMRLVQAPVCRNGQPRKHPEAGPSFAA